MRRSDSGTTVAIDPFGGARIVVPMHYRTARYAARMCAGCIMAATAGASGLRAWLQAQHLSWLTPRRMRAVTIALVVAAFGVSSVGISGSSAPAKAAHHAPATTVAPR